MKGLAAIINIKTGNCSKLPAAELLHFGELLNEI